MSDADDLQRDLELIRRIADHGVMDIEAAGREAKEAIRRKFAAAQAQEQNPEPLNKPSAPPPSDMDEDDYYRFQRFRP